MARSKGSVNKSEAIRVVLKTNPKMKTKEVVTILAQQGLKVHPNLVYFVKGTVKGRRGRHHKIRQSVATAGGDPVATIRKVKALAAEFGGMENLKALVEALAE